MANKNEHLKTGFYTGMVVEIYMQIHEYAKSRNINIMESLFKIIVAGFSGAIGGVLPDIVEPAYDPFHRAFFHSTCCGAGVMFGLTSISQTNMLSDHKYLKVIMRGACAGYLTHLVQDSETPMGLPLL